MSICEDIWIDKGPHNDLFSHHCADILLNISASPFHAGKIHERSEMISARAKDGNGAVVYVNLVGGQDELVFDGGSMVFDRNGDCMGRAASFREQLYTVDIPVYQDKGKNTSFSFSALSGNLKKPTLDIVREKELSGDEEILEALVTGTGDYIRKNGFKKAVIGLSGGIDSSIVAAIAVRALGAENVTGVTMPSRYTSSGTRSDAEILASNLGIKFLELPIAEPFDSFIRNLGGVFGDIPVDATEENIQARVRGIYLMALSNKFNWLVLTTGNKSETATGYCTLYGDMAGGFAVIKDVPKTTVYRISRLFNTQEGREIIPESVLVRPPTAELRPDQKDSDSLPEYDILDPILKAYVEDDMSLEEITGLGFDREIVKRVIKLCDISEYKRRQAPPGVKITPRAFGKDRRLPMTNRFRDM